MELFASVGKNYGDTKPKSGKLLVKDLEKWLKKNSRHVDLDLNGTTKANYEENKDGKGFYAGSLDGKGKGRDNFKNVTMYVMDFDGGPIIEEVVSELKEHAVVYTTLGNATATEGKEPVERFRVVLPLSRALAPEEFYRFSSGVFDWLLESGRKKTLEHENKGLFGYYQFPMTHEGNKETSVVRTVEGPLLDPADVMKFGREKKERKEAEPIESEEAVERFSEIGHYISQIDPWQPTTIYGTALNSFQVWLRVFSACAEHATEEYADQLIRLFEVVWPDDDPERYELLYDRRLTEIDMGTVVEIAKAQKGDKFVSFKSAEHQKITDALHPRKIRQREDSEDTADTTAEEQIEAVKNDWWDYYRKNITSKLSDEDNQEKSEFVPIEEVIQGTGTEIPWAVEGMIEKGTLCAIVAEAETGKTTLVSDLVASVTTGEKFISLARCEKGNVLYYQKDGTNMALILGQIELYGGDRSKVFVERGDKNEVMYPTPIKLRQGIEKLGAKIAVLDSLEQCFPMLDLNTATKEDSKMIANCLRHIAVATQCAVIVLHHTKQPEKGENVKQAVSAFKGAKVFVNQCNTRILLKRDKSDTERRLISCGGRGTIIHAFTDFTLSKEIEEKPYILEFQSESGDRMEVLERVLVEHDDWLSRQDLVRYMSEALGKNIEDYAISKMIGPLIGMRFVKFQFVLDVRPGDRQNRNIKKFKATHLLKTKYREEDFSSVCESCKSRFCTCLADPLQDVCKEVVDNVQDDCKPGANQVQKVNSAREIEPKKHKLITDPTISPEIKKKPSETRARTDNKTPLQREKGRESIEYKSEAVKNLDYANMTSKELGDDLNAFLDQEFGEGWTYESL